MAIELHIGVSGTWKLEEILNSTRLTLSNMLGNCAIPVLVTRHRSFKTSTFLEDMELKSTDISLLGLTETVTIFLHEDHLGILLDGPSTVLGDYLAAALAITVAEAFGTNIENSFGFFSSESTITSQQLRDQLTVPPLSSEAIYDVAVACEIAKFRYPGGALKED